MVNNSNSPNFKPARRRNVRPEQIAINVERIEHLIVEVRNAQAITQLIDGLERRLAIVEDSVPATGQMVTRPNGLTVQSSGLRPVNEAWKGNGATHDK